MLKQATRSWAVLAMAGLVLGQPATLPTKSCEGQRERNPFALAVHGYSKNTHGHGKLRSVIGPFFVSGHILLDNQLL